MTREVHIALIGVSQDEDGRETVTELSAKGEYFERGGSRFLLYEEANPDGGASTKNTLEVTSAAVILSKSGSLRSRMIFQAGQTHRADYATPYGSLFWEISTEELRSDWTDSGGTVELSYRLFSENALLSKNRLSIQINFR